MAEDEWDVTEQAVSEGIMQTFKSDFGLVNSLIYKTAAVLSNTVTAYE